MSALNYGLEQGYVEEVPIDNNAWREYVIYPRKILFEPTLHAILVELSELGFEIIFNKRDKIYYANNRKMTMKEQNKQVVEELSNKEKVDEFCNNCLPLYNELKDNFIGAVCAIAEVGMIDAKEVAGILASKIYGDTEEFINKGNDKKLLSLYEASNNLLKELDEFIRSEKNE